MADAADKADGAVLIGEPDVAIVHVVSSVLHLNGYFTHSVHDGAAVLDAFAELQPRLVILAMRLPVLDGIAVCRRLRTISGVPIVMLSVLDDQSMAARARRAGADDYIRMPFGADELAARVNAVLRRSSAAQRGAEVVESGPIVLDAGRHVVRVDGDEVMLSATEFALLAYLMRNPDRVLTHDQILETVWGAAYADSRHLLRVTMSRLRQKLHPAARELIQTLPRVGYRFRRVERVTADSQVRVTMAMR